MTIALLRSDNDGRKSSTNTSNIDILEQSDKGDSGASAVVTPQALSRLHALRSLVERMQGGLPCRLNQSVYDAATKPYNGGGNKEKCMISMMKVTGCMPQCIDEREVLESYFLAHALESTPQGLAVLAATLAAGGVCPMVGARVLSPQVVKHCLSLMHTAGMGTMSGEFQFKVGVPSKCSRTGSGSSDGTGVILMAVPNVLGVCFANTNKQPQRSGTTGEGVQGLAFCEGFVDRFAFHRYDTRTGAQENPTRRMVYMRWDAADNENDENKDTEEDNSAAAELKTSQEAKDIVRKFRDTRSAATPEMVTRLLSAATIGDMMAIKAMHAAGCDLDCADYDIRTAAHLAAANGNLEVLRYFHKHGVDLEASDRWQGTPLDDAINEGHDEVADYLRDWLEPPAPAPLPTPTNNNGLASTSTTSETVCQAMSTLAP